MHRRKYRLFALFGFLGCIVLNSTCSALEVNRFILTNCNTITGIVIGTDSKQFEVLTLQGTYTSIPRQTTKHILTYNVNDNPIPAIKLDVNLIDRLRAVYVNSDQTALFVGWPNRFVDNLVIFFDTAGKTYLLEMEKIVKIEKPSPMIAQSGKIDNFTNLEFGFGRNFPECNLKAKKDKHVVQPMRMISDQIKIEKRFEDY